MPDSSYITLAPGVYPLPDTVGLLGTLDPSLGINKDAYENCLFDFTFTIVAPESIPIGQNQAAVTSVEYLSIEFDGGNIITGAESFTCDPPSCIFNAGTAGCAKISGTIIAPPGEYDARMYLEIITAGYPTLVIPHPNFNTVWRKYTLKVYPQPIDGCLTNVDNVANNFVSAKVNPNPFNGTTLIVLSSKANFQADLNVYNIFGKKIQTKEVHIMNGENKINFDGSSLSAGMYILTIGKGNDLITEKLIVEN